MKKTGRQIGDTGDKMATQPEMATSGDEARIAELEARVERLEASDKRLRLALALFSHLFTAEPPTPNS